MGKGERVFYLDTICGILILHMIYIAHLPSFIDYPGYTTWLTYKIPSLILGFFMSWFFFKGGMFYKDKPLGDVIKSSNKRLLLPFAVFTVIGIILGIIFGFYNRTYTKASILGLLVEPFLELFLEESPHFSSANWFLLSLYVVRVSYAALQKVRIKSIYVFVISILLSYAVYYICYIIKPVVTAGAISISFPSYIGNICYGLAFYSLGNLLRDIQFHKTFFCLSVFVYFIHFFYNSSIDVHSDYVTGMSPAYFLAVIYSLAGIIVFNNVFKRVIARKVPLLTYIGKNSMIYYVTHWTTLCVLFELIKMTRVKIDETLLYVISAVILTIALILYDKVFTKTKLKRIMGIR